MNTEGKLKKLISGMRDLIAECEDYEEDDSDSKEEKPKSKSKSEKISLAESFMKKKDY